jgi:hypothetical protein
MSGVEGLLLILAIVAGGSLLVFLIVKFTGRW